MIKEKGLTQRELASKVGVTEVSMSRYIKGERVPSGPIVVNIAKELGISVDYLVGTSSVKKRQTNADRIRNMSDEELAELMSCPYMKDPYDECVYGWHDYDCNKCKLEWLQSEAEYDKLQEEKDK